MLRDFCGAIEAAARRSPHSIAIEDAYGSITYADLDRASGAVAAALIAQGIATGSAVGIQITPGIDYVTAFLGVARSGAVPMPIDTGVPPLRLERILAKSSCTLVLRELPPLDLPPAPTRDVRPDDPAYIMFTSGSTGAPKAILGCHRGLSHFLRWEIEELAVDATTRVSLLAPVTFDVSLRDILVPLCAGGTLCIPDPAVRNSPRALLAWLAERRISLVHIVPTLFRLLLAEMETSKEPRPSSLRQILLAGEPLYGSDVERWRAVMGRDTQLFNLYGPSETTLAKAFFRIGGDDLAPNRVVPIGNPLPNTAILILDGNRLCDIGEIGEIHIRTPYRSLGYLDDPELTAAVFIDNPLNPGANDIVYRTGDLGRYLPGRAVECLGRVDHQVKINGVRIEPAEIEHAVASLDGIEETIVIGHRTSDNQWTLACYFRQRDVVARPIDATAIRAHLERILPLSMIPTFFVEMNELPTTVSGKIARRALPRPEELLYERRPYRAPSNEVETALAAIWGEILGLKNVSVDHPFVELGGDSLKAIRATAAIDRRFGVEIGLRELFEKATIAALAPLVTAGGSSRAADIPALPDAPDYPASHAQHRLWALDRLQIDPLAYNLPLAFHVRGALDLDRLRTAWTAVVARHEALRTTFVMTGQQLRQRVAPPSELALPLIDLGGDWQAAERFLERDRATPFDLDRGPLLRAAVLRLAADEHLLAVSIHHIICDVWSLDLIVSELNALYADPAAQLAPLRIQYRDFATWQSARIAAGSLDNDRRYWLGQFDGELPLLELPADFSRPPLQTFRGTTCRRRIEAHLTDALSRLGASLDASLFVLLQSLVKALLHRWTGQRDIIVGAPILGRDHPDLERQVGLYVNTLALRDRIDPDRSFADLVATVNGTMRQAFAHQSWPFDLLIDELDLDRDMSRSPLFDVMVVVQDEDRQRFALPGLEVSPHGSEDDWTTSRFDLVFHFTLDAGELVLDVNLNSDLFRPERAAQFADHFEQIVRSAVEAPGGAVGAMEIIPPAEVARMETFGQGEDRQPHDMTIVSELESQVSRTPQAIALVHGDRTLTYEELDARATALAEDLIAEGVEWGDRVGVIGNRTIETTIALVAALKCGAVCVPIDRDLPPDRKRLLLDAARCRVVLDDHVGARAGTPPETGRTSAPHDVAYMIFTSGSTGAPKGVLVEHGGFANMMRWMIATCGIGPGDRVAQFASASFDASLWDTFSALLSGAALVLLDRHIIEQPSDFLDALERHGVTVITLPPVYLAALGRAPMPGVRILITAGEAARAGDSMFYAQSRDCYNAYGPTETSVCATMHRVDPADGDGSSIPIGRPVNGSTVLVLDSELRLTPLGFPGEICVAGRGLAQGYDGNAEETAQRFVLRDGERIYRTGDRGRWRLDGTLEFIGRLDDQVKIRGHRVELGSVAHALRSCGAGDVYVTAIDGALAAWYTAAIEPEDLRARVADHVPHYEVPSYLVGVARLPLNGSGKVDRQALPDPHSQRPTVHIERTANDMETRIAHAWGQVLGTGVGANDNFFSLGGDSIKAIRIVSLLHQENIRLAVRDLFRHPTIREVAPLAHSLASHAEQGPVTGDVAATPICRWLFDRFVNAHHFNQSVALRARTRFDVDAVRGALQALLDHHDALRMHFAPQATIAAGMPLLLEEITATEREWREEAWRVQTSFDLAHGPLVRTQLVHLPDHDLLWIVCHHTVVDAVSWGILLEDFQTAYRAGKLPPKTTSFQTYAAALAEYSAETERAYWRNIAALPPLRFSPANEHHAQPVELDLGSSQPATQESLLVALSHALKNWCGADRVVVDLETHGRSLPCDGIDVSRTVGWFTAFYPFVLEHGANVREALRAVPNGGIGYGLLTQLATDRLAPAVADIGFNYLGELASYGDSGALFAIDWNPPGHAVDPTAPPLHAVDVLAAVIDGRLNVTLSYDPSRVTRAGAIRLAAELQRAHESSIHVRPDFTFDELSQDQVDQILADLR